MAGGESAVAAETLLLVDLPADSECQAVAREALAVGAAGVVQYRLGTRPARSQPKVSSSNSPSSGLWSVTLCKIVHVQLLEEG